MLFMYFSFVFMALMEYCLVNIVLGDSDAPKPPEPPKKPEKIFDIAAKVSSSHIAHHRFYSSDPLSTFFPAMILLTILCCSLSVPIWR